MKFLVDMNLTPQWVAFLEDAGYEAVHWRDLGALDAPDGLILRHASEQGLVLITQDLDFGTLLALGGDTTPSVIQFCAQALLPTDIGEHLLRSIEGAVDHLLTGALLTIDPEAHRVTLLPIRG